MSRGRRTAFILVLILSPSVQAGLHYSEEKFARLPSQWRGFLLDHASLRMIAVPAREGSAASLIRQDYIDARDALAKKARTQELSADEAADLGALLIRLGQAEEAIEVLRPAQRQHPEHFRLLANLGTAWQLAGDLPQAEATLREAVRLAPEEWKPMEEYHLKLVQVRQRNREREGLDSLFGVPYTGEDGQPSPGSIAPEQMKQLPKNAAAIVQQLALWMPSDGHLLWQLGELANAHGDVRTAANMLEGCVTAYGMNDRELRQRRQIYRAVADKLPKSSFRNPEGDQHPNRLVTHSSRPLIRELDLSKLPTIREGRTNLLPWIVLAETEVDRKYRPTFPKYLEKLDNTQVAMTGFMQALGDELEVNYFLFIEYPVGCWFCETPDITAMVFAELPPDETMILKRGLVKIEGKLSLNHDDPEDFLFSLTDVQVREAD